MEERNRHNFDHPSSLDTDLMFEVHTPRPSTVNPDHFLMIQRALLDAESENAEIWQAGGNSNLRFQDTFPNEENRARGSKACRSGGGDFDFHPRRAAKLDGRENFC